MLTERGLTYVSAAELTPDQWVYGQRLNAAEASLWHEPRQVANMEPRTDDRVIVTWQPDGGPYVVPGDWQFLVEDTDD